MLSFETVGESADTEFPVFKTTTWRGKASFRRKIVWKKLSGSIYLQSICCPKASFIMVVPELVRRSENFCLSSTWNWNQLQTVVRIIQVRALEGSLFSMRRIKLTIRKRWKAIVWTSALICSQLLIIYKAYCVPCEIWSSWSPYRYSAAMIAASIYMNRFYIESIENIDVEAFHCY